MITTEPSYEVSSMLRLHLTEKIVEVALILMAKMNMQIMLPTFLVPPPDFQT